MFRQAVVAMCSHILYQRAAELRKWLYDLIREVVEVHGAFLGPAAAADTGGSLRVIGLPIRLPTRTGSPRLYNPGQTRRRRLPCARWRTE